MVNMEIRMATGTVKWFNPTRLWFIQPTGGGEDIVCPHIRRCAGGPEYAE